MTGTECFRAALNILSETPDSGVYYEQFALGALNQLLANSLREMNAERASDGKDVLLVPPRMTALTEELPAGDWLARECFPYGLAALLVADDDKAKFNWAATEYSERLLSHCPAQFTAVQVGEAEQYLAMAGFSAKENIAALPGVLNLAAAYIGL